MKSFSFRIVLILAVLMIAAAVLPAFAETNWDYTQPDPASVAGPWWDYCARPKVVTKTRVVVRQAETLIESIPAEGYCYTAIKKVNVRSQPSIYATKVMTIRAAGTEFIVTSRAKNSSGEIWYAVELANGTLGYIRSDLLNTDHVILMGDPYAYEDWVGNRQAAASESASSVINIAKPAEYEAPTPKVIYVTPTPAPTPTPILVYVTPEPPAASEPDVTPQIVFVTPEPESK
jgi:hypothetical protein